MNRLEEIIKRMGELQLELRKEDCDLDAIEKELRELKDEKAEIEKREAIDKELKEINAGNKETKTVETFGKEEKKEEKKDDLEKRGQDLYEKRAVTVSSGDLVTPKHDKGTINPGFNQVSSLVDRVNVVPLNGGESYEAPFELSHGEGSYTVEGEPYFDVTNDFDYATINKTKVTAYTEITEEVLKLPRADYATKVIDGVRKAIRKKIAKEILNGTGATGQFAGLFSAAAAAINPATDIEIGAIDEDTLDNIIYKFGGDEEVEDPSVLILSKDDLRKFALLRIGAEQRKAYEVVTNGNTGTINGVPFIINSAAGNTETAAAGDFLMAYGPLSNYEMAVFSPLEIKRSEDVKFKEGMIAHRGSVLAGGNVVAANGFLRVKKETPAG